MLGWNVFTRFFKLLSWGARCQDLEEQLQHLEAAQLRASRTSSSSGSCGGTTPSCSCSSCFLSIFPGLALTLQQDLTIRWEEKWTKVDHHMGAPFQGLYIDLRNGVIWRDSQYQYRCIHPRGEVLAWYAPDIWNCDWFLFSQETWAPMAGGSRISQRRNSSSEPCRLVQGYLVHGTLLLVSKYLARLLVV